MASCRLIRVILGNEFAPTKEHILFSDGSSYEMRDKIFHFRVISRRRVSCHLLIPLLTFSENEQDMYPGFQGFTNFFPGQGPDGPGNMNFMVPNPQSTPPHGMDPAMRSRGLY